MERLESIEFGEEQVKGAEEFERGGGVEVDDSREGKAKKQIVRCAASEPACVKIGHACEVGFVEEECIEPIHAAFVGLP